MTTIQTPAGALTLRTELRVGDLAALLAAHVGEYVDGRGFGLRFEAYVAQGLGDFAVRHDLGRERIWMAEDAAGRFAGVVAIVDAGDRRAQLRWFLVEPAWRGRGLGGALLREAIAFARSAGYSCLHLWTVSELEGAAKLYRREGFVLVEENENTEWAGRPLVEQRYELKLPQEDRSSK